MEISGFGDRVKINEIGEIAVSDYTPDSTSITPQTLGDAQKELHINQRKYFAFKVDDVSQAQMKPKVMDAAMRRSAYSLRDQADQYIAGLYTEAGVTSGLGTTASAIDITSVNIIEYIGLCAQGLDENNVPLENRWMIIPPWFKHKIVLSGITLKTDNDALFASGSIGEVQGFNLFVSNNVVTAASNATSRVMFGDRDAVSYASQIVKLESYRPESSFSDAVKGLMVYGAKVVRPGNLGVLTCDYTAEP